MLEEDCAKRMKAGTKKYGKYDYKTDKRDMLKEIREEAIDIVNYCRMERMKNTTFDYRIERLAKEIYRLTFRNN